jgi:short-subunit dehydrogenase
MKPTQTRTGYSMNPADRVGGRTVPRTPAPERTDPAEPGPAAAPTATSNRRGDKAVRARYGPWALITGASSGIGKALATQLAARGINLVLVARSDRALHAVADDLRQRHRVNTIVIAADLADPNAVDRLDDSIRHLDVGLVVLAAGYGATTAFADAPLSGELEMIAVNITAVTRLAHTFARRLSSRGRGGIMLLGSIVGWQGVPGQATYAATKAYVQTLAEALHHELAPRGIDVLSVAPGPVHTGFAARAGLTMNSATTPDVVARAAVAALGRRITVVPGFRGKFLTTALAMLPRVLRIRIMAAIIRSWRTPAPAHPLQTRRNTQPSSSTL